MIRQSTIHAGIADTNAGTWIQTRDPLFWYTTPGISNTPLQNDATLLAIALEVSSTLGSYYYCCYALPFLLLGLIVMC